MATKKVTLEIDAEMKKLSKKFKDLGGTIDKFGKNFTKIGKAVDKSLENQAKAVERVTKAFKKNADAVLALEKKKQKSITETEKAFDQQQKSIRGKIHQWLNKPGGVGGTMGGFLGGVGLGGLTRPMGGREIAGTLGRGVSMLGGGALGFLTRGAAGAYQQAIQYGLARGQLTGLGTPAQMKGANRMGVRMGYGPTETAMLARGVGVATGNIGAVGRAQQFARATGMDIGAVGGAMGMMRQAGYGFGGRIRGFGGAGTVQAGREGTRELTKIMEAGMISGIEKARLPEFLQGVSSIATQMGGMRVGKINVGGVAGFMARMGQTGLPGLQGARGAQLAQRVQQGIIAPGGGEAGQALMLQAMGFGKPGGTATYYEALKQQQQGLTPENFEKVMTEVYSQYGDPNAGGGAAVNQEANLALSRMLGISIEQAEALKDVHSSSEGSKEKQEKMKELMKKAKPIQEQALGEMKKFGGTLKHIAGMQAEQIGVGKQWTKLFQTLEHLMVRLLNVMSKSVVPLLETSAKYLPQLYHEIKDMVSGSFSFWTGQKNKEKTQKELNELVKQREARLKQAIKPGISTAKKSELLRQAAGIAEKAAGKQMDVAIQGALGSAVSDLVTGENITGKTIRKVAGKFRESERIKQLSKFYKLSAKAGLRTGEIGSTASSPEYRRTLEALNIGKTTTDEQMRRAIRSELTAKRNEREFGPPRWVGPVPQPMTMNNPQQAARATIASQRDPRIKSVSSKSRGAQQNARSATDVKPAIKPATP